MGNQGKFTKKRSRKTTVFLHISVLISHLVKDISRPRNPYARFTRVFESIAGMLRACEFFLRFKPNDYIKGAIH